MNSEPKQPAGRQSKILIRVDSSTRIGTGHMMRCFTLAEKLRAKNCDVTFVARAHPGNINSAVAEKGFSLTELPAPPHADAPLKDDDYPAWLGVTQDQDAQETLAATEGNHFDWLVVDHYSLDAQWEAQMRARALKIMAIDDLANRTHDCDVLLDQNFHPDASTRYESLIPPTASRFIGPQYALLRQEFHEAKKTLRKRTGEIKRVLVCMGGSDPDNVTGEVVGALLDQRFSHLEIQVVVGPSNPHLQSIEAQTEGRGNFRILTDVQNMATLMADSDFAIGGGGTMLWERAFLELPSLVVPIAENQQIDLERLKPPLVNHASLQFVRGGTSILSQSIGDEIHDRKPLTTQQVHVATSIGSRIESLCALFGANSQPATRSAWHLRRASVKDENLLWFLFVDREVRDVALSHEPPDRAVHQQWLWEGLHHPSERLIFIAENEHGPLGQVRFDRTGAHWVIDIALTRQFRGRGYGSLLLQDAIEGARQEGCHSFIALVRRKNTASRKVFDRAGFREMIEPAPDLFSQVRLPPEEPDVLTYCLK